MGFLFADASRNSALAFLIFGAFLIAQGGVLSQKTKLKRVSRVMIGVGILSAVAGIVLWIAHRF